MTLGHRNHTLVLNQEATAYRRHEQAGEMPVRGLL